MIVMVKVEGKCGNEMQVTGIVLYLMTDRVNLNPALSYFILVSPQAQFRDYQFSALSPGCPLIPQDWESS